MVICSSSPNTVRRSASSRMFRLGSTSRATATSAIAASRARFGHSPPAMSATAKQRLPHIGVAIIDAGRHFRSSLRRLVEDRCRPARQPPTQGLADRRMNPAPERLDLFLRCAPAHADDDRARQDRIRQPAKPGQRDGRIRWRSPPSRRSRHGRHNDQQRRRADGRYSTGRAAPRAPSPSRPKTVSISSNKIVGGPSSPPTFRNKISRRDVHGRDRIGNEKLRHFH